MSDALADRQRGALIGLAVGDALGAAVEFRSPGSFPEVTGYRDGGPHGLEPGQWTDDTSMALALADSIVNVGWDLADQMRRYLDWYQHGKYSVNGRCFDVGVTVSGALGRFRQTPDPQSSASRDERSSGNGSIMRLAPVPVRYADLHLFGQHAELARRGEASSLPTHASPQCLSACRLMTVQLAGLMYGVPRETVLNPNWPPVQSLRRAAAFHEAVEELAQGSFLHKEPPEIRGSGYVVHSLEAALWAFARADNFQQAVLAAVNLGDDADTTGAVCGQYAGACWGESGIAEPLLQGLAEREMLQRVADQLIRAV